MGDEDYNLLDIIDTPEPFVGSGTTRDGIKLPSLPTTSYSYDPIDYSPTSDHKANGSFRENFGRGKRDLNSVLIGGYIKCEGPSDEEIRVKLGGGAHSDSDSGKAGRCYEIGIKISGTTVTIRKEGAHSDYHETGMSVSNLNLGNRSNHYTGVMFMKVNQIIYGKECVRCICWIDTAGMSDTGILNSAAQDWKKVIDATDSGDWFSDVWLTTAKPGDSIATLRTDQQDPTSYRVIHLFCSRIKGGPAY